MPSLQCIKNAKRFKSIIETLGNNIEEGVLVIGSEGMKMSALDNSHTVMTIMNLHSDLFEKNLFDKAIQLPIEIDDFAKILDRSKSINDIFTIEYDEAQKKFSTTIRRKNIDNAQGRYFTIPLKTIDTVQDVDIASLLEIKYDNTITVPVSVMIEAIADAKIFSNVISLAAKKTANSFSVMFACSDSNGSMEYNIEQSDLIASNITRESCDYFAVDYFAKMIDGGIGDKVKLSFSSVDNPLKIEYVLDDTPNPSILVFFLAPRVSELDSMTEEEQTNEAGEDEATDEAVPSNEAAIVEEVTDDIEENDIEEVIELPEEEYIDDAVIEEEPEEPKSTKKSTKSKK